MQKQLSELLRKELDGLMREEQVLLEEIKVKTDKLDVNQTRQNHVRALLDERPTRSSRPTMYSSQSLQRSSGKKFISDLAEKILKEISPQTMHYRELLNEVQSRGGNLGGRTPSATLVAILVRDGRFLRPERKGFYALKEDYPKAQNVGARSTGSDFNTVSLRNAIEVRKTTTSITQKNRILNLAEEILRQRTPQSMHYKDLSREILERGVVLRGKTPEATIRSYLGQDKRFIRPGEKGHYTLRQ